MSRPSRLVLAAALVALGAVACGTTNSATDDGGAESGPAPSTAPIGASCTPTAEQSPSFAGFSPGEVGIDTGNPACGGAVCLVNHFQGLTTCPFGQDSAGNPPPGAAACRTPGGQPVAPHDPSTGETVQPQCADRRSSNSVYCSCRCANADGRSDDGATYCACPGGFTCMQLVAAIGTGDTLSGAYCVEDDTSYDVSSACDQFCLPSANDCP
jgi:hypothetical protein